MTDCVPTEIKLGLGNILRVMRFQAAHCDNHPRRMGEWRMIGSYRCRRRVLRSEDDTVVTCYARDDCYATHGPFAITIAWIGNVLRTRIDWVLSAGCCGIGVTGDLFQRAYAQHVCLWNP